VDLQTIDFNSCFLSLSPPSFPLSLRRGAAGVFTVTANLSDISVADFAQVNGQRTPLAVRFSTVIHGLHSPEFLRDPRGFALKLYTQEGNYDIVGNNWPVFFIRDGMR